MKAAAADLKALLEKDPDNPGYNNDLGYIWADHDMNLAESEKLIRKALDEDRKQRLKEKPDAKPDEIKDNPSYLDSLGWVLFKEKKSRRRESLWRTRSRTRTARASRSTTTSARC